MDLENIEEIFSLAAATSDLSLNQSAALAIAATLHYAHVSSPSPEGTIFVRRGLTIPSGWKHEGPSRHEGQEGHSYRCPQYDIYALVMAGLPDERSLTRRDTIISLNYDTLVEDGLSRLQIPFSYGFDKELPEFDASAHCIRKPASEEPDAIRVLKLHGSVNWAIPIHAKKLTVFGNYEDVRSRTLSPLLIPPTWRKDPAGQLSDVWDKAVQALSTATRIAIIGYSIPPTDLHFKYLLAVGLQNNISLRNIFFFNPAADSLRPHLDRVLRSDLRTRLVRSIDMDTRAALSSPHRQLLNRLSQSDRWAA